MNFNQFSLDPRLLAAIARAGYVAPTPIQLAALPPALAGNDLLGTAQTGTGKTAAFVLPILQKLLTGPRGRLRALIISPTRELAQQTHETIRDLGAETKLRSATIYGGVPAGAQIKALRDGVEIIVACPGRLLDHIEQRHAKLGGVEVLVLDEADRMLDMGFLPSVRAILKQLPTQRQTMLFSATCPPEIEQLAAQTMSHPKRIAVGLGRPAHTVAHALFPIAQHQKTALVLAVLKQTDTESVLIFTRTKHRAQRLADQIGQAGYKVTSLHSNRTQGQRQSALNGFKGGKFQIMVATDIAARGLDVESISHVINYDMPDTADAYIHRIGRTGRMERTGDAFTLITPEDRIMVRTLEKVMGQPLPRQTLADFDYTVAAAHTATPASRTHPGPRPAARAAKPAHRFQSDPRRRRA
ncbi:MAG: DEAD/DEAH box helicase [Chloroflexi bacterium]|nr:DEAD/DEAH box helicase [Chloroflexota bacterium]